MSKAAEIAQELEELYDPDINDDDYVFVLGPDGELKQIILPDDIPFAAPKTVAKILKMFKINDIDDLAGDAPLH